MRGDCEYPGPQSLEEWYDDQDSTREEIGPWDWGDDGEHWGAQEEWGEGYEEGWNDGGDQEEWDEGCEDDWPDEYE